MLVLSRKRGQAIVIDGNITISILAVDGDRVKVGIAAPVEIPVHREEVGQRIGDFPSRMRMVECA